VTAPPLEYLFLAACVIVLGLAVGRLIVHACSWVWGKLTRKDKT